LRITSDRAYRAAVSPEAPVSGTQNRLLSPETQPTVTVVGFVLAMIALAVSVTAVIRVRQATSFAYALHEVGEGNATGQNDAVITRLDALEKKLAELEARPAAAAAAAPVAAPEEGKAGKGKAATP
jgi:hypothetical protein